MKYCKTFYEVQTVSRLKEIIQPPPTRYPTRWNLTTSLEQKFSQRDIHKYTYICFEECSYWVSRNGPLQIFFLTPNRNMFAGKFVKWVYKLQKFLIVFREHIIFDIRWVEVHKISEVFWVKPYWKWMIFFASFCCLWDFLLENLKSRKTSDDVHWTVRKKVVYPK